MGEGQAGRTALRCPLPETRERRTEEPRGRKDGRKSRTYPFYIRYAMTGVPLLRL